MVSALCAAALVGCGGGSGGSATSGTLKLSVTDAPVDSAVSVVVTFAGVELQPSGGDRVDITYSTPRQIDLLALQGGLSTPLLDGITVPAGDYSWIRLKVVSSRNTTESFVQLADGSIHSLFVPSGVAAGTLAVLIGSVGARRPQ